jgi:hypothetical protein
MLGPLVTPGSDFLELLVAVDAWSFVSLRLPDVVRRVIYAPGASSGEVALVEQSRPELLWPVDIILGASGNAVLSGRWRAFALGHRLRIGDRLIFHFKLETLEASVRIFTAAPIPSPRRSKGGGLATVAFWGGELVSSPLLQCSLRRRGMPRRASAFPPTGGYQ